MKIYRFPLFFITWVLLNSCNWFNKEKVTVTYRNFSDEIEMQQNLDFTFSHALVPETEIGKWIEDNLIDITPQVKGKFKWLERNRLIFSPEIGFQPNTDYKVVLKSKITEKAEPSTLKITDDVFTFHTPYLSVNGANVYWAINTQSNMPEVRADLQFNYPINPNELNTLLSVSVAGQTTPYTVLTANTNSSVQVSMKADNAENQEEKPLIFQIAKGLQVPNSDRKAEALRFESIVPSREFRIAQVLAEYDNDEVVIHVYTNQTVGTPNIANFVEIYAGNSMIETTNKEKTQPKTGAMNIAIEKLEQGFLIRGNFQTGTNYNLFIKKGLSGIFQTSLAGDYEQTIAVGELTPHIAFASKKAMYLTHAGSRNVGVRIIAVPKITVTVHKIFENNIAQFIGNMGEYDYYDDYSVYYPAPENYGNLVFSQEFETATLKKAGNLSLINLSFAPKNELENKLLNGVYLVSVSSSNEQWKRDTRLISVSDIGLVVKHAGDEVLIQANSIYTAEPLEEIDITLVSTNNQAMASAKTDKNGIVRFTDLRKKAPTFDVGMITAQKGSDFTFLHFKNTAVNTFPFELGGMYENPAGLQAFIYGDRDLYRPEDDAFIKTILRDRDWNPLRNQPVKLKVILPNGKEFAIKRGNTTNEGSFETAIKIPASTVTGTYLIEVYSGNDVLLASKNISVEEFMPDRIKVNLTTDESNAKPSGALKLSAQALNLFGTPAVGRKYEGSLLLASKPFRPKGFDEYSFAIYGSNVSYFDEIYNDGQTDDEGRFQAEFPIPAHYANIGMLEAKLYTTVFDENGRGVGRRIVTQIPTQEVFLGIGEIDRYVSTGKVVNIPLVALNSEGMIYNTAKARVQIIKLEWQTVMEKDYYGSYRYISQAKERVLQDNTIQISGRGSSYQFVPTESGEYQLRVFNPGTTTYAMIPFYAYSWGTTSETSFEVEKDGKIAIQPDKETYQTGETAKVLFKCPFDGKLLVTLERNRIFEHYTIQTVNHVAELSFKLKEEHLPNLFISATLIKPITDNAIPLTVAHGYQNIVIEKLDNKIELSITAPEKVRSGVSSEIVVQSSKRNSNIEITVAVVDEGILQIKNYKTPNPYDYFYQKRALQVNSYDVYPRLFPELRPSANRFGADGYDLGKRTNPLTNKRVKLVSFWSGTLKTDGSGQVKYKVDIPKSFSGDLRIMAVAAHEKSFGSAEKSMKVADPLVVSVGLPRFASPDDEMTIPVTVSNTTAQVASVTSKITVSGAMTSVADSKVSAEVPANGEKTLYFTLKADKKIGTAEVLVETEGLKEKFVNKTDITVRPTSSLLKASGSGRIEGGKSLILDLKQEFLQTSVSGKLTLTKLPFVEYAKEMSNLIQYPHGCLEQTISTAFPQLYAGEWLKTIRPDLKNDATYHINETIRKVQTMQLYDGSLAYWQGGSYANWWSTAYSAHFLSEAQKAGFDVENKFLERIYQYLQARVKAKEKTKYTFITTDNKTIVQELAPREATYTLYVLALAGKKDLPTMNYYKSNVGLLTTDSKYMLAAAFALAGDAATARKLQPANFSGNKATRELDGSFSSHLRDIALTLNVLLETEPNHQQVSTLAKQVSEQLKATQYPTTQELAFSLTALGKLAQKAQNATVTATIKADGKEVGKFDGNDLTFKQNVLGKKVEITTSGSGNLYYFWEMEGLNENGKVKEEDSYLQVRREFYDRKGNKISESTFKQNDLIVVKLTLQSTGGKVENVVVTDMLPACFEIENPRLNGTETLPWLKESAIPQHIDYRDDRINFYTTAYNTKQDYYYMVRVVGKGKFKLGIASADAMYNGDYRSYHGAGEVKAE